jgi:hypothetical protein
MTMIKEKIGDKGQREIVARSLFKECASAAVRQRPVWRARSGHHSGEA